MIHYEWHGTKSDMVKKNIVEIKDVWVLIDVYSIWYAPSGQTNRKFWGGNKVPIKF